MASPGSLSCSFSASGISPRARRDHRDLRTREPDLPTHTGYASLGYGAYVGFAGPALLLLAVGLQPRKAFAPALGWSLRGYASRCSHSRWRPDRQAVRRDRGFKARGALSSSRRLRSSSDFG